MCPCGPIDEKQRFEKIRLYLTVILHNFDWKRHLLAWRKRWKREKLTWQKLWDEPIWREHRSLCTLYRLAQRTLPCLYSVCLWTYHSSSLRSDKEVTVWINSKWKQTKLIRLVAKCREVKIKVGQWNLEKALMILPAVMEMLTPSFCSDSQSKWLEKNQRSHDAHAKHIAGWRHRVISARKRHNL